MGTVVPQAERVELAPCVRLCPDHPGNPRIHIAGEPRHMGKDIRSSVARTRITNKKLSPILGDGLMDQAAAFRWPDGDVRPALGEVGW
jgi:hypothetical protein